jgi:hypothetical protein
MGVFMDWFKETIFYFFFMSSILGLAFLIVLICLVMFAVPSGAYLITPQTDLEAQTLQYCNLSIGNETENNTLFCLSFFDALRNNTQVVYNNFTVEIPLNETFLKEFFLKEMAVFWDSHKAVNISYVDDIVKPFPDALVTFKFQVNESLGVYKEGLANQTLFNERLVNDVNNSFTQVWRYHWFLNESKLGREDNVFLKKDIIMICLIFVIGGCSLGGSFWLLKESQRNFSIKEYIDLNAKDAVKLAEELSKKRVEKLENPPSQQGIKPKDMPKGGNDDGTQTGSNEANINQF